MNLTLLILSFKEKLIHYLGGYTSSEVKEYADIQVLNELGYLKNIMDTNYGNNWEADLYQAVIKNMVKYGSK